MLAVLGVDESLVLRLLGATEDDDVLELVGLGEDDDFVLKLVDTTEMDFVLETVGTVDDLVLELVEITIDNDDLLDEVDAFPEPVGLLAVVVYGGKETLPLKSYTSNRLDPPQNSE